MTDTISRSVITRLVHIAASTGAAFALAANPSPALAALFTAVVLLTLDTIVNGGGD